MQPQREQFSKKGQIAGRTCQCSPRSSVISDLNGEIENILPKRVARRSSKIELRREPIPVLSERVRIEGIACSSAQKQKQNKRKFSYGFPRPLGLKMAEKERIEQTDLGSWRHST